MNTIDLSDQTAVITGGARGLGFGVAVRLLASGAKVALWDMDEAALDGAKAALSSDKVHVHATDITDYQSVENALSETEKTLGPVSILVNSAGVAGPNHTLDEYPLEAWRQVIDIDLNGAFHVNRAVVPGMKARNYGRIVNIASIAAKEGNPNASAYAAAKAGVVGLTKSLGKELATYDIAVNAITPSVANTPILNELTEEFIKYMLSKVPRGRFLEIEELAGMVAWLVSKENSFTTGSVFDLSGGRATY